MLILGDLLEFMVDIKDMSQPEGIQQLLRKFGRALLAFIFLPAGLATHRPALEKFLPR